MYEIEVSRKLGGDRVGFVTVWDSGGGALKIGIKYDPDSTDHTQFTSLTKAAAVVEILTFGGRNGDLGFSVFAVEPEEGEDN